jgi:hypothetical protein
MIKERLMSIARIFVDAANVLQAAAKGELAAPGVDVEKVRTRYIGRPNYCSGYYDVDHAKRLATHCDGEALGRTGQCGACTDAERAVAGELQRRASVGGGGDDGGDRPRRFRTIRGGA